jgi:hypothetical protein
MHLDTHRAAGYLRAMNAVVRQNHEVSMLTNEAIEVHLASLHKGQDELREDVRELRADNKSLREKVDVIHESLAGKIAKLSDDVASMRGMQKAMLWVMSGLGSLGLAGKIFRWF